MHIELYQHITKGLIHSLLLFFFLNIFFEVKRKKYKSDYLFFLCSFIIFIAVYFILPKDWLYTAVSLILLSIPISRFFINPFAFQWIYITLYIFSFLSMDIFFTQLHKNFYMDALKLIIFNFIIYLIYRYKKMKYYKRRKLSEIIFLLVPFISLFILIYDCYFLTQTNWQYLSSGICRMILIVLLNFVYDRTIEKLEVQHCLEINRVISSQNMDHYKAHYYERLESQQEEIRSIKHDMKNQLIGVWGELEDGRIDAGKEELAKILSKISSTEQIFYTKNAGLNAVLNFKAEEMKRKHILYDFHIKIPEQIKIDGKDMGLLVGNVLDNAVEGCEKCLGKRQLSLRLIYDRHTITMICENSTDGLVTNFKSRKENSLQHGLGIKSIRKLVKEFGGEVDFMIFSASFQVRMVLWNV